MRRDRGRAATPPTADRGMRPRPTGMATGLATGRPTGRATARATLLRIVLGGLGALGGLALPTAARGDDWQVTRSEFDPRLLGQLKEQLRRRPDDAALLRRLVGLYRKHSSVDKLAAELVAQAERSGSGSDLFLAAQVERERGKSDEAARLLERAMKPGGLDVVKGSLLLSEWAQKRTPPDYAEARKQLERALGALPANDARRKAVLRRQVDLALGSGDMGAATQALGTLIESAQGSEVVALRRERAEALGRANKPAEALAEYKKLEPQLGDSVKRAEAQIRIGELCEATQDELAAMAAYRKGLSLLPQSHYLRRELYDHLIALHRKRDELPTLLKQLEADFPVATRSFGAWEMLGRLYDERGDTAAATTAYRAALRKDPHSIDVRRRLLAILERSGVTPEVLAEYEQLINYAPGDSRAYLELAERQHKLGQRDKALATLRRAAQRFQGDPSLHSALADIYQRWGEAQLALAESELLIRLDPREESYVINLGEMYWARGRKDKAEEVWRRLLTLNPNRAVGQARLADVYAEHNKMPEALDLYQKAVRAEPNNLQLRRGLAQATERMNRPREAVQLWEQIYFAARAPSERLLRLEARQHLAALIGKETRLLASIYSWQRRFQAQMSQPAQPLTATSSDPAASGELLALGLLLSDVSLQAGRLGEAESVLVRLRARFPDGPMLAEVLLALVPVYRYQRKLDEAIAALKQAATLLPDRRRELYAQLAELSMQSYRDDEAIKYAEQAVADAQGELRLGELLERKDDVPRAMAAYKRAIEQDPRLFRAHMALGRLHLQRGELAEAAALYRDVVRRTPQEELIFEAGKKAIDLHEYLGTLGELLRELLPLSYASLPKPAYRKLLLLLFERYATPLVSLARAGDAAAQAELVRLGQSGLKPLTETLGDGELGEQRVAVALLGEMKNPSAAPALLALVSPPGTPGAGSEPRVVLGSAAMAALPRATDMDLRVDALLAAARLEDPHSLRGLAQLVQSREKQIRLAALYGLVRLADKLDKPEVVVLEQALSDPSPAVRIVAALGLGQVAAHRGLSPRHAGLLVGVIERRRARPDEVDEQAAAACVHALGRAGAHDKLPLLVDLLREGNDEVQRQAAWALGALGEPRAAAPLLQAVFTKREPVRQAAVLALSQLGAQGRPGNQPASPPGPPGQAARPLPAERRGVDGLDAVALLRDAAAVPALPVASEPAWQREPAAVASALVAGLREHHDVQLRTLEDLTAGGRRPFALGPLPLPAGEVGRRALEREVGAALLPVLKSLARPQPGATAAADPPLRRLALLALGGLLALDEHAAEVATLLQKTAEDDPDPERALLAVTLLERPAGTSPPAAAPAPAPVLDRFVAHADRWVRLLALQAAARSPSGRYLSQAALERATTDRDGYVRDLATQLLQRRRK
ncbi:MAG: tetratricopeptide repeat protein [Polyangia bacterium]